MVIYGVTGGGRLVEVHCFYTETYLVTVHRDACPELTALATRLKQGEGDIMTRRTVRCVIGTDLDFR